MALLNPWKQWLAGIASPAILWATLQSHSYGQEVPPQLRQPENVVSENGKIDSPLEVVFGKVKIPSSTPDGSQTIGVRAYALPDAQKPNSPPMVPGPTFVFQPGDLLRIRFKNLLNAAQNPWLNGFNAQLPGAGGPGKGDSIPETVPHEISIPNGPDITNLHVHGLHVDPKQDNVTLVILPEDSDPSSLSTELQRFVPTINRWWTRNYQYKIPQDHLPGTYWYHSHKHGSTSTQVENGMAGTLVMLPNNDQDNIVPGLWSNDPAQTHDRVMVIQQLTQFASPQGFIRGAARGSGLGRQLRAAAAAAGGKQLGIFMSVNGVIRPSLQLPVNQVERWRFVIAGANHTTSSNIWVGSITPELDPELSRNLAALQSTPQDPNPKVPDSIAGTLILRCRKMPGTVRLTAVDGITIWQSREITPSAPAMGSAGNRLELLIQATSPPEEDANPYRIYQNYPLDPTDLAILPTLYPKLFGKDQPTAGVRLQAVQKATVKFVDENNNPLPPNNFNTDTYALGSDYLGQQVPWATVTEDGTPTPPPPPAPTNPPTPPLVPPPTPLMSIAPLIRGVRNPATNGIEPQIRVQDINDLGVGWQPLPDATGAGSLTQSVLVDLDISGTASGPPMPTVAELDATMDALSPAGNGKRLMKVDSSGNLVPGFPAYVAKFDEPVAGRQAVIFDRGQFTFNYVDKSAAQTLAFRQFWLNGRQFNIDDFQGNPAADSLIQAPLANVAPEVGAYIPNDGSAPQGWTNQVNGATYVTNPGYYVPLTTFTDARGATVYNYDYANPQPLNNKAVSGLDESTPPVSTTSEEWLLVNNSDLFHPFHIHISPFFVTEIGQLNYESHPKEGPHWTFKKLTLADKGDHTKPFSWVVGNWWDVITLPPHGYVKMKTWINVPSQFPVDKENPDSDLIVKDNANVYGSWVLHCHILRHEDRGMMTMVNTVPKLTSLAGGWTDDTQTVHQMEDVRGGLAVTELGGTTYSGTFAGGVGNPLLSQPWLGSMSPATGPLSFCVNRHANMMVLSDGHIWQSKSAPASIQFTKDLNLSGDWKDDDGNLAKIDDKKGSLKFESLSPVWWNRGIGTWVPNPKNPPVAYVGTQTLKNEAGQVQVLTFCVSGDLKTMVFGNGITWQKVE